jgi:hypothetical protein
MRRIGCFFGFHQWIPIRYIWVKFHAQMYFKNKYSHEGEQVVSKLFCPICGATKDIKVEL